MTLQRLLIKYRSIKWSTLLIASLLFSIATVGAYIPFRVLSPKEVAIILKWSKESKEKEQQHLLMFFGPSE